MTTTATAAAATAAAAKSAQQLQAATNAVLDFLEETADNRLAYIQEDQKYAVYQPQNKQWVFLSQDALLIGTKVNNKLAVQILQETLKNAKRVYHTKTYSDPTIEIESQEKLNMMLNIDWIKPSSTSSDNLKYFEYLLKSLGNYKEENIMHIKQVIGWKYMNPGAWNLPAICLYGRGGSGKNLLASTIMSQIFGTSQCLTTGYKRIEKYDGILAGKMAVLFDEHPNKEDQSTLKGKVGQPKLSVELKNVNTFTIDNLALYFLATNDANGPVYIENNGSERRWSMIYSSTDLKSVFAKEENITEQEAADLIDFVDEKVFRNKDEVAIFLNECIKEAKKLTSTPIALHGEDFKALKDIQKDTATEVFDEIFVEYKDFNFISMLTLYNFYICRAAENNPGARPLSLTNFKGRLTNYLQHHKEIVVEFDKRYNIKIDGKPIKSLIIHKATCNLSSLSENTSFFNSGAHYTNNPKLAIVASNIVGDSVI